ncbi:MAG: hypothetical protein LBE33_04615 [Zoogloeaceae bacterium]|jgi:hypothetical protein|nr:hypothetical protein [Zoogloeaceae bacterium]
MKMKIRNKSGCILFAIVCVIACAFISFTAPIVSAQPAAASKPATMTLLFRDIEYEHRWSKAGQNEFTPHGESDLNAWNDMLTLNVHDAVSTGEQLADVANKVLGNYQRNGKILRTDSKPRTTNSPAEHLVVAVLGTPAFLEAAFARFVLTDGIGIVIVYSHRIYGKPAGSAMSDWLKANGPQVESALMAWNPIPKPDVLKRLPQRN